jgi:hypothetical protein
LPTTGSGIRLLVPLALTLAGWACAETAAATRMAVPDEIRASSDLIAIERLTPPPGTPGAAPTESFTMGPYRVSRVNRDWQGASDSSVTGYGVGQGSGGYAFIFRGREGAYSGQCATVASVAAPDAEGGVTMPSASNVLCECNGTAPSSTLIGLDASAHRHGTINARGLSYQIDGIYARVEGAADATLVGYEVRDARARPSGAVEIVGPGRVWLNRSLDAAARADLACVFAGLLLYKPPAE